MALRRAEYATARAWLERSLGGFRSMEARWAEGVTLANLADIALDEGRLDDARRGYDESLVIAHELGDSDGIGYAQTGLAQVAREKGDLGACRTHLQASLAELREQDEKGASTEWLEAAGALAVVEGRDRTAVQLFASADALRSAIGAPLSPKDVPAQKRRLHGLRG